MFPLLAWVAVFVCSARASECSTIVERGIGFGANPEELVASGDIARRHSKITTAELRSWFG